MRASASDVHASCRCRNRPQASGRPRSFLERIQNGKLKLQPQSFLVFRSAAASPQQSALLGSSWPSTHWSPGCEPTRSLFRDCSHWDTPTIHRVVIAHEQDEVPKTFGNLPARIAHAPSHHRAVQSLLWLVLQVEESADDSSFYQIKV